jgi:hypothetical protein
MFLGVPFATHKAFPFRGITFKRSGNCGVISFVAAFERCILKKWKGKSQKYF